MERVPAPKHNIIKENIEDLIPPGLICYCIYLTGEPAACKIRYPGDIGVLVEFGDSGT